MMRYSTYQSIYESVNPETAQSGIGDFKKKWPRMKMPAVLIRSLIVLLIILIGCSTVLNVFAGGKEDRLALGGKLVVSQGDTLWNIAVKYKPDDMDTRDYIEEIKAYNELVSSSIQVGQVLTLP